MSKLRKKDLHLKEDAFVSLIDKIRFFIDEHKKWFIIGTSFLIVFIIILVGITNYSRYKESKAKAMEENAYNLFFREYIDLEREIMEKFPDEEAKVAASEEYDEMLANAKNKLNEALLVYEDLHSRYGSTASGERALYMAGYINYQLEDYEKSLEILEMYYKKYGEKAVFFIPCIKNIASLYELSGEAEKAIGFLEGFLSKRDFLLKYPADSLLLQLGLLLMSEGNYSGAVERFSLLEEEYPESMLKSDAEKYRAFAMLNISREEKFEAEDSDIHAEHTIADIEDAEADTKDQDKIPDTDEDAVQEFTAMEEEETVQSDDDLEITETGNETAPANVSDREDEDTDTAEDIEE